MILAVVLIVPPFTNFWRFGSLGHFDSFGGFDIVNPLWRLQVLWGFGVFTTSLQLWIFLKFRLLLELWLTFDILSSWQCLCLKKWRFGSLGHFDNFDVLTLSICFDAFRCFEGLDRFDSFSICAGLTVLSRFDSFKPLWQFQVFLDVLTVLDVFIHLKRFESVCYLTLFFWHIGVWECFWVFINHFDNFVQLFLSLTVLTMCK